jgi:hypothetical protein
VNKDKIVLFRSLIEEKYQEYPTGCGSSFGEILCYEIHSQPINRRMGINDRGITFKELANKWGISVSFLGELIMDHCEKLE